MTTMSSPYSNTYMFLPISPTPPSGMMRSGVSLVAGVVVMAWSRLVQNKVSWSASAVAAGIGADAWSAAWSSVPEVGSVAAGGVAMAIPVAADGASVSTALPLVLPTRRSRASMSASGSLAMSSNRVGSVRPLVQGEGRMVHGERDGVARPGRGIDGSGGPVDPR